MLRKGVLLSLLLLFVAPVWGVDRVIWDIRSSLDGDFTPPGANQQTTCVVGDFTGNGISEIVMSDRATTPSLVMFVYNTGTDVWARHTIDATSLPIEAGGATHDIDGDGDLDIAIGADFQSDEIWWWENPSPNFNPSTPWTRRLIKNSGGEYHHDQAFGDFDGDGQTEYAAWVDVNTSQRRMRFYEIPADPKATQPWPTFTDVGVTSSTFVEGAEAHDVDQDGQMDLLAGGRWFRHQGGSYSATFIDPTYGESRITAADIIPGGYLEVFLCSGDNINPLAWYFWDGSQWCKRVLIDPVIHGHSLELGDIDQDGHIDLFAAEMGDPGNGANCTAWIGWGDSKGNFVLEVISVGRANHMSQLADFDGDGRLDIVMKPFKFNAPRLDVFLNRPAPLPLDQWQRHLVDNLPWRSLNQQSADINGDGFLDMVAGGWWFENPGQLSQSWVRRTIGGNLNNVLVLHDYDCDGDVDLLGTQAKLRPINSSDGNNLFYYAQNDGTGVFSVNQVATSPLGGEVFPQGFTGGTLESGGEFVAIFQWQGGEEGLNPVHRLSPPAAGPASGPWNYSTLHPMSEGEQVTIADVDGDGDADVYQGTGWLRNDPAGVWTHFVANDTTTPIYGTADRNRLVDMDKDGDLDAVIGFTHYPGPSTGLAWFENPGIATQTWTVHMVVTTGLGGGFSMDVADPDRDGDFDIILGEHMNAARLLIFENTDGVGGAWTQHVIDAGGAGIDHHVGSQAVDLDGDGDLDVMSIGWTNDKIWVFENKAIDVNDQVPPTNPTGLSAVALSDSEVQLNWLDNPEADLDHYEVHRSQSSGFIPDGTTLVADDVQDSDYTDANLAESTTYYYVVIAVDNASNASGASSEVGVVTAQDTTPPAITSVAAPNDTTVVVVFTEDVQQASAELTSNYSIPSATVTAAVLLGDLRTVSLTTSVLAPQVVYTLTISGVQDLSVAANSGMDSADFVSGVGLEAFYRFELGAGTTANDSSGNSNHGTIEGALWTTDPGDAGVYALQFDGVDDRVAVPALDVQGTNMTLTAWVNPDTFNVPDARIISKATGTAADDHAWMLSTIQDGSSFRLRFRVSTNGSTATLVAPLSLLTPGVWTHVAGVYDGAEMIVYQDGVEVGSAPLVGSLTSLPTVPVAIGDQPVGLRRPFDGALDDVRVYSRALSATEVAALAETPPEAVDDSETVDPGDFVVVDVLANDSGGSAPILLSSVEVILDPLHGTAAVDQGTGTILYIHDGSATTSDSFTYRFANTAGDVSNTASVSVTVGAANLLITDGLVLHLESGLGVVTSGSTVLAWQDQSGLGNDLVALGAPQVILGALGGQPALSCDGVDDAIERTSALGGFPSGSSDRTMIAVVQYFDDGPGGVSYGNGSCNQAFGLIAVPPSGNLMLTGYCGANDFSTTTPGNGAGWLIHSAVVDTGSVTQYMDGLTIGTGNHSFATVNNSLQIGREIDGAPFVSMQVAAVLVYNRALTPAEHGQVVSFLTDKYLGTSSTPPLATDDRVRTIRGGMAMIDVVANDTDDAGIDPATVAILTGPTRGLTSVDPTTGVVTYSHSALDMLPDSFSYQVLDVDGNVSNIAQVQIVFDDPGCPLIQSGLVLHLDAGSGLVASGSNVLAWLDDSGFANDFSALGTPTIVENALNGHRVVQFGGGGDSVERTAALTGFPSGAADRSVFYVVNYQDNGPGGFSWGDTNCNQVFGLISIPPVGELAITGWCTANDFVSTEPGNNAGWLVHSATVDASFVFHYRDDVLLGQTMHSYQTATDMAVLGAEIDNNRFVTMQVAEVLVYDRALDLGERDTVYSYFRAKYFDDICTTACVSPTITAQPLDTSACVGDVLTLSVGVSGTGPFSYQWRRDGTNLIGQTGASLNLQADAGDSGSYDVVVSNACGTETSATAVVTVGAAASIVTQPTAQTVCQGTLLELTSLGGGLAPLSYQWRRGGVDIPGATAAVLTVPAAALADAGIYDVVVSNGCGTATSTQVPVVVRPAPVVTGQPVSLVVCEGSDVSFDVTATGEAPLSFQWRHNGAVIFGATTALLNLSGVTAVNAGHYDVVVTNACGSAVSSVASLTLEFAPSITQQPVGGTVCEAGSMTLAVTASGTPPLTYQWSRNGVAISGSNSSSLPLGPVDVADAGSYTVAVSNTCGNAVSAAAVVAVDPLPVVTTQPQDQVECAGDTVQLSVAATTTPPVSYAWRKNGIPVPGATSASLTILGASRADAGDYDVVITDACSSVTSAVAVVTVRQAPVVTTQPQGTQVCLGSGVTLAIAASGSEPLSFQWRKGGAVLGGETGQTLSVASFSAADAGDYDVVVQNSCGSATSATATLSVAEVVAITSSPTSAVSCEGDPLTLSVVATGASPLAYQWFKDGAAISGETAASLAITSLTTGDAGDYQVTVSNQCGSASSASAVVTVDQPPVLNASPLDESACPGTTVTFDVSVSSSGAVAYQWRKDGAAIAGANASSYSIAAVGAADAGVYDVVLSTGCAPVTSSGATLTVLALAQCDCNSNGLVDELEVANGTAEDCNGNGIPDECDIASGFSMDLDGNSVPDECASDFTRGDCSANGSYNIQDAIVLLEYLFVSGSLPVCLDACDASDDGGLNLLDVQHLLCGLFCAPSVPPAGPYPLCGPDPTPDALGCDTFPCP